MIKRIALTGGPCAGKTTALSNIEEKLTEKGYVVFIIPESATELMKSGINISLVGLVKFQEIILKYQLQKEKIYDEVAKLIHRNKKVVIIHDRGVIDNKAYIGQKKFNQILRKLDLKEINLMDRYDMVIHLVTAADGKEEYYTVENNKHRRETVDEAKELDKKTINAWAGHNNLKIIDNSTNFEDKINRMMDCIYNLLKEPTSLRFQRKFLVDLNNSKFSFNEDNSTKIDIVQTYLGNTDYEKRLRKRIFDGEATYFLTVQSEQNDLSKKVITNQKISEKEYQKIIDISDTKYEINKTRYTFSENKQYFRLDIFSKTSLALLEVDVKDKNDVVNIPSNIKIIKEVSNDINYRNINIAKKINKDKSLKLTL